MVVRAEQDVDAVARVLNTEPTAVTGAAGPAPERMHHNVNGGDR